MIIRYCFVRLAAAYATEVGRAEALAAARRLDTLAGIAVVAGVGADASAASWDLAITIHAESLERLAAAMATPTWAQFFDDHLGPRAVVVKAWNFATAAAPTT